MLSVLIAIVISLFLKEPIGERDRIRSAADVPWLKFALWAYAFGSVLVPLGIADPLESGVKTLRIWVLLVALFETLFLVPCALAPRYGWSSSGILDCVLIPLGLLSFVEVVPPIMKWLRDPNRRPLGDNLDVAARTEPRPPSSNQN